MNISFNTPTRAGIVELKEFFGVCKLCKNETAVQKLERSEQFVLPEGWQRLKYIKTYDYYVGTDYFLFCSDCVNIALNNGYEPL